MATAIEFKWNDSRLTRALETGAKTSFAVAVADAQARQHNRSKSGIRLKVHSAVQADLIGTGLQGLFEQGRKGGYPVYAGGVVGVRRSGRAGSRVGFGRKALLSSGVGGTGARALIVTSGSLGGQFFSHVEPGPMRAYPAMKPAAQDWARRGYAATSQRVLMAQGFGVKLP